MSEPELIRIRFEGGLADTGQLHFYEYSRSQYALARFIATVEHFRRTGRVAERIGFDANIESIIRTPEKGSFIEDVLIPKIQEGMASAVSTSLSSLISYIWNIMAPRSQKSEDAIQQFAKIRAAEEESRVALEAERTKQEVQRTEQERVRLEQLRVWQGIGEGERASTRDAIQLARWALAGGNAAVSRLGLSQAELTNIEQELVAEKGREESFGKDKQALEQIDEPTMNRLTSRLRPMVTEIGLPLRRSAKSVSLSKGKETVYVRLDDDAIRSIQGKESEEDIVTLVGRVKGYDRDVGVGKVSSVELPRVLSFTVPLRDRDVLRDRILDAMRKEKVLLVCRRIVDKSGLPTSLILIDLEDF